MARNGGLLRLVARCLPREFRERVFEPAIGDYRLELASRRPGASRRLAGELWFVAECLRIGVPQFVWMRGRPTRAGRIAALAVIVVVGAVWLGVVRAGYTRAHP